MTRDEVTRNLLELAFAAGDGREMAILGEGNVSGAIDAGRFLVKASGTSLRALRPEHLVEVQAQPFLKAIWSESRHSDEEVQALLMAARVDPRALKPSVESIFHAWLLALPGVAYVGHVHATAVNQLLCSPAAEQFAHKRLFPDQIVYCGPESVLVPYVDPGLPLARRIAAEVDAFRMRTDRIPATILIQNHGLIALGPTHHLVMAALDMAEKAARIFIGAASVGGPIFLSNEHVRRIADRADEHYRQRMLEHPPMNSD